MKELLRTLCLPMLRIFESSDEPYAYKPSHRRILVFLGSLFSGLAILVLSLSAGEDPGYLFPVLVFSTGGVICLMVGLLGTDRAVAKIWGSRQ